MTPAPTGGSAVISRTIVDIDLVGYSSILPVLQQNLGVAAAAAFDAQIKQFVEVGVRAIGLTWTQAVIAWEGDGGKLAFEHARQAHDFAEGIHRAAREHNSHVNILSAHRWFRVGAATGEVILTPLAGGGMDRSGWVVVVACRLQAAADPGQLVVDPVTYAALPEVLRREYGPEEPISGKRMEAFLGYRYPPRGGVPTGDSAEPTPPPPPPSRRMGTVLTILLLALVALLLTGIVWVAGFLLGVGAGPPGPVQTAVVASFLGVGIGVALAYQLRRLRVVGERRQREGIALLAHRLLTRLDEPEMLWTPNAARGLASAVEARVGCAMLTDKMILEAIRLASLELDERGGSAKYAGIQRFNKLLLGINADARPLLSLANTDRLDGYIRSLGFLTVLILLGLVLLLLGPIGFGLTIPLGLSFPLVVALLTALVAVLLMVVRATRFWNDPGRSKVFTPRTEGRVSMGLDFLLAAAMSRAEWAGRFWDLAWGPVWEFGVMHTTRPTTFAVMHEFRYEVARRLWANLRAVQAEMDALDPVGNPRLIHEFRQLSRELWVVTGDEAFRRLEARGEIVAADLAGSVTSYL